MHITHTYARQISTHTYARTQTQAHAHTHRHAHAHACARKHASTHANAQACTSPSRPDKANTQIPFTPGESAWTAESIPKEHTQKCHNMTRARLQALHRKRRQVKHIHGAALEYSCAGPQTHPRTHTLIIQTETETEPYIDNEDVEKETETGPPIAPRLPLVVTSYNSTTPPQVFCTNRRSYDFLLAVFAATLVAVTVFEYLFALFVSALSLGHAFLAIYLSPGVLALSLAFAVVGAGKLRGTVDVAVFAFFLPILLLVIVLAVVLMLRDDCAAAAVVVLLFIQLSQLLGH